MNGISQRLRAARRLRGYPSSPIAARALGWPPGTYTCRENGQRPPKGSQIETYAEGFGVSAGWLATGVAESDDDHAAMEFLEYAKRRLKILPAVDIQRAASTLRKVREMRGFVSGSSAATTYGWSISAVANHESGRVAIPSRMAGIYAFAYDIPRNWLDPSKNCDTDAAQAAPGGPRPRRLVDDFSARIDAADFGRRPSLDWIPIYAPRDALARFNPFGSDRPEASPAQLMPLVSGFATDAFGLAAQDVAGIDLPVKDRGGPLRTRFFVDALRPNPSSGPWLTIDAAGEVAVVEEPEPGTKRSGKTEMAESAAKAGSGLWLRIVATMQVSSSEATVGACLLDETTARKNRMVAR